MEDLGIKANMYIQLIQSVWAECWASTCTLYSSIVYRHAFLSIATGSAVCICLKSLVFHFACATTYLYTTP